MRKALMFAALAHLATLAASPALAASCTGSNARYVMPGADGFTLTLTPRAEPLAWSDLDVVLKTPTRRFLFSLTASNGYSYNYAVQEEPAPPPEADDSGDDDSQRIYFFNAKMDVLDLPQGKNPAPDMVFLPDFGGALWYGGFDPREFLPIAMWRLEGCG
jgi:hypothetical protein